MKTIEMLLKRPFATASYYSGLIAVVLVVFTFYAIFTRDSNADQSLMALPINFILAVLSIGFTFLPSAYLRLFTFKTAWERLGQRAALTAVLTIIEAIVFVFILNYYMSSMIDGGIGSLALVIISVVNAFAVVFWALAAGLTWLATRNKPILPSVEDSIRREVNI